MRHAADAGPLGLLIVHTGLVRWAGVHIHSVHLAVLCASLDSCAAALDCHQCAEASRSCITFVC
jgi:hypothetical protein